MKKLFTCTKCHKDFRAIGFDNPVFLADIVANCPDCNSKCWERTYTITASEFKRLKRLRVNPKLFY
jgi:hypothetical protein